MDTQNMLAVLKEFPTQIEEALKLAKKIKITKDINNMVIAGMGGSGHAGDLLAAYVQHIELPLPIFVVRDYALPSFVDYSSLVFIISYSGNTEETLNALDEALAKEAQIVVITSGGKLQKIAEDLRLPLILVPQGLQPRLSIGYLFVPLLTVLSNSGILHDASTELNEAVEFLRKNEISTPAQEIALKLKDKIPLIYTSSQYSIVGYIWKILINECSKTHAFHHRLPEMNHNEINAYKNINAKYFVLFLEDESDHPRVKDRIKYTKEIIANAEVDVLHLIIKGHSYFAKVFQAIYLGMYVSYYLAMHYKTDPTPVPVIEQLKTLLATATSPQQQTQ